MVSSSGIPGVGVAPLGRHVASLLSPGSRGRVALAGRLLTLVFAGMPGVALRPVSTGWVSDSFGQIAGTVGRILFGPASEGQKQRRPCKSARRLSGSVSYRFGGKDLPPEISSAGLTNDPPEGSGREQTGTGRLYQTGFGR